MRQWSLAITTVKGTMLSPIKRREKEGVGGDAEGFVMRELVATSRGLVCDVRRRFYRRRRRLKFKMRAGELYAESPSELFPRF